MWELIQIEKKTWYDHNWRDVRVNDIFDPLCRLAVIEYKGDAAVMMVDLSEQDGFDILHLPAQFLGKLPWLP